MNYCVYLLECSDSSLYCGITNDIKTRIERHNSGSASKYTRTRLPVKLICAVNGFTRSEALKLEFRIKLQFKTQKEPYLLSFIDENHKRIEI